MPVLQNPLSAYFDLDGLPLDGGFIYFGTPNQNPETSPQTVYWDSALTVPAAQPIRTVGGYPARAGTPAVLYSSQEFSQAVYNARRELIFYLPSSSILSALPPLGAGSAGAPSLSFAAYPTTGIYQAAANAGGLSANGVERLRWTSLGVGIGGVPAELLDVFGTTRLRGTLSVTTGGVVVSLGGITVASGGLNIAGGGATITGGATLNGSVSVPTGVFASRGFTDNATSQAWNIDTAGRLRNNANTQLSFAARRITSAQSTTGAAIFQDTGFAGGHNVATFYDTATGVATVPAAQGGDFLVMASCAFVVGAAATAAVMELRVNGAAILTRTFGGNDVGAQSSIEITSVLRLAAGDTVQVYLATLTNTSMQIGSHFSIRQVG